MISFELKGPRSVWLYLYRSARGRAVALQVASEWDDLQGPDRGPDPQRPELTFSSTLVGCAQALANRLDSISQHQAFHLQIFQNTC